MAETNNIERRKFAIEQALSLIGRISPAYTTIDEVIANATKIETYLNRKT